MTTAGSDHAARAEVLQLVLQDRFWMPCRRLFRVSERRPANPWGLWHHWWQSHALAALLDRCDRTGDPTTRAQAYRLVEGMRRRGCGRLTNDFYDDMGWLALQLLRMPGREPDLDVLVATLRRGAMPEGGLAWGLQHPEFRNVPATGPAAIVAMRLGVRRGDDELAGWGLSLLRWMRDTLVGPGGDVPDGFRVHPDGGTSIDPARYSYNYGLVIGAELAAHAVTGEGEHLERALVVARAAFRQLSDPTTGIWLAEGRGDRALFRGILAGHVADLALATGETWCAVVVHSQAEAVWAACRGGPVGFAWPQHTARPVELSEHVGGLLVVEAAARLGSPRARAA